MSHHEHDHEHDHAYLHAHGIAHSHGHVHENQKAVVNRLARALGHLEKVKKMVEEARLNIKNDLVNVDKIVSKTLNNNNYQINYGNNYFPNKELNGIEYQEGNYESLVVNIGSAEGNNWWCVLFPPLCMIEGTYKESNKIEYKSKILEILNKGD